MPSRTSERVILLVLAAIQFTHIIDFMVLMPLAPQLMRELDVGAERGNGRTGSAEVALI